MARFTAPAFAALLVINTVSCQLLQAIVSLEGPGSAKGNITLSQNDNGPVSVLGKLTGLSPGKHGFHIHEKGDLTGGCASTAGHFNPYNKKHGGPADVERHVGDLGNIIAGPDGSATVAITDSLISLTGANSILGRAIVVHSDADDLGTGGYADSLTTGHAGTRVACGVIGVLAPKDKWPANSGSVSFAALTVLFTTLLSLLFVSY